MDRWRKQGLLPLGWRVHVDDQCESGAEDCSAYNLAKAYSNQLVKGEDYPLLNPAIAVTITDFILFKKTEAVINKFVFKEKEKNFEIFDEEWQLIFVELPKFKKILSELNSLSDKWIYFLKEAARLEEIPESLREISEIEFALNLASQVNMTVEEFEVIDRRGMMLQDEKGRLTYAEDKGRQEGRIQQAIALVMRLLKKRFGEIPAALSTQVEDLSLSELETLTEDIFDFNSLEDVSSWLEER